MTTATVDTIYKIDTAFSLGVRATGPCMCMNSSTFVVCGYSSAEQSIYRSIIYSAAYSTFDGPHSTAAYERRSNGSLNVCNTCNKWGPASSVRTRWFLAGEKKKTASVQLSRILDKQSSQLGIHSDRDTNPVHQRILNGTCNTHFNCFAFSCFCLNTLPYTMLTKHRGKKTKEKKEKKAIPGNPSPSWEKSNIKKQK